jgi:mRNA interferase MazF
VNVGDIHWVELPAANGHEQQGRRPAVVAQNDDYASGLPTVLVIPLSSARQALRFAGTVLIRATQESGLRLDSVALVFQCRAVDRSRVKQRAGMIRSEERLAIFEELDRLVGRRP